MIQSMVTKKASHIYSKKLQATATQAAENPFVNIFQSGCVAAINDVNTALYCCIEILLRKMSLQGARTHFLTRL